MGSVTHQYTVMTKQTSAPLVTDALTMQLNVVKAVTESSAGSLLFYFYENQMIRLCRPRRLYQGQFRTFGQIMAWPAQATGNYLNKWWLVYWRIYASLGLNELPRCRWIILIDTGQIQPVRKLKKNNKVKNVFNLRMQRNKIVLASSIFKIYLKPGPWNLFIFRAVCHRIRMK